jgi:hypothetical protein
MKGGNHFADIGVQRRALLTFVGRNVAGEWTGWNNIWMGTSWELL